MPIVFFSCVVAIAAVAELFFQKIIFGVGFFFFSLSRYFGTFIAVNTHIIIVVFFSVALAGVISYVDARILTHLITFAEADAGAGIQCVGGLCLCYRNKRFQWLYAVCVAA